MTSPATPSSPKPAADDRKLVSVDENYIAPTFEDKLHIFWKNNGKAVLALCVVVLLGIVAYGAYGAMQRSKELDIEKAYADAKTNDQLKAFAAANPDHTLAGIASLRLADEAYTAGKSADAIAGYEKAAAALKTGPLAGRALLGKALSKAQAGKAADAVTDLKSLVADGAQPKGLRAEAIYQLASLAAEANDGAEVQKFSDQLQQLDPNSPWSARVAVLRATVKAPASTAAPTPATGGVQVKIPGTK